MARLLLLSLLVALALPAAAKIYKWVTPDGRVVYSDRPQSKDAEEIQLGPVQTYSPAPLPAGGAGRPAEREAPAGGYERLAIVAPAPDEVIRDNGGTVAVRLAIEPALRPGDRVEVLLDGRPIGAGAGSAVTLTNVDRGTHTVTALVRNAEGREVARADPVTFHLKRHFVRRKAP